MGLMMLAAGPGSVLLLIAEGVGAEKALAELELLIEKKFNED
jgi:phosphotransferase system HPr-like phosphotransfer protein